MKLGEVVEHGMTSSVEDKKKGTPTLILLWGDEGRAGTAFAFPHTLKHATEFVKGWLEQVEYDHEPDHDGHNEKGWRVFNEAWGHVAGHHYAIVAIQPEWAMYGK